MQPHVLHSLGRTHDVANVRAAAALARDTFPTFNLDVIYGGAGETLEDWRHTLQSVLALEPPHVSAYALTVEAGTPLADDPARHPDDDDQADKYLLATDLLRDAGLDWYEISNWARPGHECRHNWLYWSQGEYLGVGCAAHSHRDGRRWWNVRTPERYIDAVEAERSTEAGAERLAPDARELEGLQLALRTRAGVPSGALPGDPELSSLVVVDDDVTTLTIEGRLLANEVALRLRHPASTAGSSKT
jgi:oxygen-independent coproporphyrinogen-3 oxidase